MVLNNEIFYTYYLREIKIEKYDDSGEFHNTLVDGDRYTNDVIVLIVLCYYRSWFIEWILLLR